MIATDQCTLAGRMYTATVLLAAVARVDDVLGSLDGGHNFRVAIGLSPYIYSISRVPALVDIRLCSLF